MTELQKKLKYSFLDPSLLTTALTHSSYANERSCQSYERLEFVGDSVLGMVTAAHLYALFPNMTEGKMTRLRAELVCEQSLWQVAQRLELGDSSDLAGARKFPVAGKEFLFLPTV